jgi:hypothetical protein
MIHRLRRDTKGQATFGTKSSNVLGPIEHLEFHMKERQRSWASYLLINRQSNRMDQRQQATLQVMQRLCHSDPFRPTYL